MDLDTRFFENEPGSSRFARMCVSTRSRFAGYPGGVVELGKEVGVDTPLNRAVADILSVHPVGRRDR